MSRKTQLEVHAARAFALKDYARALGHLEELLAELGENPHTLHMMALCQARRDRDLEAIELAARALEADPDHMASLQLLTEIHFARGDHDQARAFARRALAAMPQRRVEPRGLQRVLGRPLRVAARGESEGASVPRDPPEHARWLEWARALVAASARKDSGR